MYYFYFRTGNCNCVNTSNLNLIPQLYRSNIRCCNTCTNQTFCCNRNQFIHNYSFLGRNFTDYFDSIYNNYYGI